MKSFNTTSLISKLALSSRTSLGEHRPKYPLLLEGPPSRLGRGSKADVRFGSKADICGAQSDVHFSPKSDRESGFPQKVMSALPPKADMSSALAYVCFGP